MREFQVFPPDHVPRPAVPAPAAEVQPPLGRPLDPQIRAVMESRFGHDFGRVRVHTDARAVESAGKLGARAYTAGSDIVFGAGEYAPGTPAGAWVLAHELAHVIQQQRAAAMAVGGSQGPGAPARDSEARRAPAAESGAGRPDLEREAGRAASAVMLGGSAHISPTATAPAIQMLRVTNGEFGVELEWYTKVMSVPDDVVRALLLSPTFMKMARSLDLHYIALDGSKIVPTWHAGWEADENGVLQKGPFKGRRVLAVWNSTEGSKFEPASSPENRFGYDIILIEIPGFGRAPISRLEEVGTWVETIAHETTHAFNHVTGSGLAPGDVAAQIRASVTEEAGVRKTEAKVITEIKGRPGGAMLKEFTPSIGSTEAWAVERDFFPGKLRSTYLEAFVFSHLLSKAIAGEGLSGQDQDKKDEEVKKIPVERRSLDSYLTDPFPIYYDPDLDLYVTTGSDYVKYRLWLRIIDARWKQFEVEHRPGDPDYADAREKLLQEHAAAFFEGIIAYTARPAPKPAVTP